MNNVKYKILKLIFLKIFSIIFQSLTTIFIKYFTQLLDDFIFKSYNYTILYKTGDYLVSNRPIGVFNRD